MRQISYESLSKTDRRSARDLAKKLLRSVPTADKPLSFGTTGEALQSAFLKPEKLLAVLIYSDCDEESWFGDLIFQRTRGTCQMRMGNFPLKSYEAALERVTNAIASIKATSEHPVVQKVRDMGFEPEETVLFGVQHENAHGWLFLDQNQITILATAYYDHVVPTAGNSLADRTAFARFIVLQLAPEFAAAYNEQARLESVDTASDAFLLHSAAAFLVVNGVFGVASCEASNVNCGQLVAETDENGDPSNIRQMESQELVAS